MNGEMRGQKVIVRPLHSTYFHAYITMFSLSVQRALHVTDVTSELTYLHEQLNKMQRGETFFYCIFDSTSDQLIGAIEIRNNHYRGQLYSWIHEDFWGNGRFQEALKLVAQVYFQATGLSFFNAHVDIANQRSCKALKKCGAAHAGFCDGPYGKQYEMVIRKK